MNNWESTEKNYNAEVKGATWKGAIFCIVFGILIFALGVYMFPKNQNSGRHDENQDMRYEKTEEGFSFSLRLFSDNSEEEGEVTVQGMLVLCGFGILIFLIGILLLLNKLDISVGWTNMTAGLLLITMGITIIIAVPILFLLMLLFIWGGIYQFVRGFLQVTGNDLLVNAMDKKQEAKGKEVMHSMKEKGIIVGEGEDVEVAPEVKEKIEKTMNRVKWIRFFLPILFFVICAAGMVLFAGVIIVTEPDPISRKFGSTLIVAGLGVILITIIVGILLIKKIFKK